MPLSEDIQFCDRCDAMIAEGDPYGDLYGVIVCQACYDELHATADEEDDDA